MPICLNPSHYRATVRFLYITVPQLNDIFKKYGFQPAQPANKFTLMPNDAQLEFDSNKYMLSMIACRFNISQDIQNYIFTLLGPTGPVIDKSFHVVTGTGGGGKSLLYDVYNNHVFYCCDYYINVKIS